MARQSSSTEIEKLIRAAENSRRKIGAEYLALRHKFDLPDRLKDSLRSHPTGWMFGSAATGLLASKWFRRGKKPRHVEKESKGPIAPVRKGVGGLLLGVGFAAAKPLIRMWLANRVKIWVSGGLPVSPKSVSTGLLKRNASVKTL